MLHKKGGRQYSWTRGRYNGIGHERRRTIPLSDARPLPWKAADWLPGACCQYRETWTESLLFTLLHSAVVPTRNTILQSDWINLRLHNMQNLSQELNINMHIAHKRKTSLALFTSLSLKHRRGWEIYDISIIFENNSKLTIQSVRKIIHSWRWLNE